MVTRLVSWVRRRCPLCGVGGCAPADPAPYTPEEVEQIVRIIEDLRIPGVVVGVGLGEPLQAD